ncbi:MAG: CDP-diacylglycerol--glycerol-3-phosphate 3-phosphatidyltransferase [Desulfobulbaceae bacterium]|nr:CDP-diacylglycerol--glycerol-3-phosphate 3-phosphatidyltransferase [Desulfobulbaceae bacterium]MCK5437903.1 CDP-diacylglycerol--glycerol-3-phosphate 3-phosphatidyltransferase [Desulfobulbaceae bacterium]
MNRIITLPNILTAYRFAVVPVLLFLVYPEAGIKISLLAFAIFLSAVFTDLADGYYARKQKQETTLGKLMDPLADKVLVSFALIMLIPMGRIPAWVSFLIIAREIMITGLRGVAASSGIVVAASGLGKIKSIFQYTGLCVLIFPMGLLPIPFLHQLGLAIIYVALFLTVWSGIQYFFRFQKVYLVPMQK